jgi:hypothetical protein
MGHRGRQACTLSRADGPWPALASRGLNFGAGAVSATAAHPEDQVAIGRRIRKVISDFRLTENYERRWVTAQRRAPYTRVRREHGGSQALPLLEESGNRRNSAGARVLRAHLGATPARHAYAGGRAARRTHQAKRGILRACLA